MSTLFNKFIQINNNVVGALRIRFLGELLFSPLMKLEPFAMSAQL
jgi:hypothetical protein